MVNWNEEELGSSGEEEPEQVPARKLEPSTPNHQLVPQGELEHELTLANDPESLKLLSDKVAAVHELARRMNMALEELNRLAETRLRVARKLGEILHESVRRGGKSKLHDETSTWGGSSAPLPEGITKIQSFRLQQIANIREEHFERYFQEARARQESITVVGLLRAARRYAADPHRAHPGQTTSEAYWERIWDAVTRVMDVDLCVGVPAEILGSPKSMQPKEAIESRLSGNLLVRTAKDAEAWLTKLAQGRRRGSISEALILFVPRTGQAWFRLLESGGWICCFLEKPESMVSNHALAYLGDRKHAFWLVLHEFGTVLRAADF